MSLSLLSTTFVGTVFRVSSAVLVALAFGSGTNTFAQETRAGVIAQQQAEKAKQLRTYEPSKAERLVINGYKMMLNPPGGVYPLFGSVYSGGGFTLGAGVRRYYGDRTFLDAKGMYSISNYKWLELSTDSLGHAHDKVNLSARIGWRDMPEIPFYGLGTDSVRGDKAHFGLTNAFGGADIAVRPAFPLVFGAGVAYEDYDSSGVSGSAPSIEEKFGPADAPGLDSDPVYIHSSGRAGIDWRPAEGYARKGGLYQLRYDNYADRDDVYSFDRVEADIVQHVPLLRENWVISLHGRVETTLNDNDTVPYYLMPSLGSGSTLRAFSSWRFRDRHSMLLQAEWRWFPNRLFMDMALFYDAGKVTSRRSDLDLDGLKSDYGIGVRFHSPTFTALRIELAQGNEGLHLVFAGSAPF
jgi:hypothetical protein